MKKYKIAYLSSRNPEDMKSNSGIQYHMLNALREQGNEVDIYYPSGFFSRFSHKVLNKIFFFKYKSWAQFKNWPILFRLYGVYFSFRLWFSFIKYDFIFTSRGAHLIPYLNSELPLIYTSDITFELMYSHFKGYDELPKIFYEGGQFKEKSTLLRSSLCIFPSYWAASSAIKDYKVDPDKVVVIPSGANFDINTIPDLQILAKQRSDKSTCKILFVGRYWDTKGGDIAFNTVRLLNEQGVKSSLTVVGCLPPFSNYPDWLTVIERLDKNIPEQNQTLVDCFVKSHFFLLPTRYEAFGLVFAEACAYGLPCLGTNTGGVPMSVKHNKNGFLFDLNDDAEVYAAKLLELWRDDVLYSQFSSYARDHFENKLNWNSWGVALQKELIRVLN